MSSKQTPGLSRDETDERIKQALYYLTRVVQDMGIPRNIRRAASEAVRVLMDPGMSPGLRLQRSSAYSRRHWQTQTCHFLVGLFSGRLFHYLNRLGIDTDSG